MPRVAVLIDAENIAVQFAPAIIQRARSLGDLNIVRLYGDFTEIRLSGWLDVARVAGYEPMLQLSGGRARNSTDIALVIDAMDILHSGAVDAYCIVSDDRDFVPLASRLRAAGKRVFAICRQSDERLRNVCSEVFPLTGPSRPAAIKPAIAGALSRDEQAFMQDLIDDLCRAAGKPSVHPSVIGLELRRRNAALADRIGGEKFIKRLKQSGVVREHGDGPSRTISSRRAA